MTPAGVRLVAVDAAERAGDLTQVHEAAASAAYAHIFSGEFPRQEVLTRWSAHRGRTVLAIQDREPVGFAAASPDGTLEGLYVLPRAAGTGLGTALLDAVHPVHRLWVLEANHRGRTFYERRGWRWSGVRQAADDAEGVPELLYVR